VKLVIAFLSRLSRHLVCCAVAIGVCLLCGCSTTEVEPLTAESSQAQDSALVSDLSRVSYTLSLRRASLTSQDFESYKLLPVGVFIECGVVYRGRPETKFQNIEQPDSSAVDESKVLAREIIAKYRETESLSIDPVGSSAGFTDPGAFTLQVSDGDAKIDLRTSVDWVEQRRSVLATLVNRFTQTVRALPSNPPCGTAEFYGIGRLK
jgi:hypothetical protein